MKCATTTDYSNKILVDKYSRHPVTYHCVDEPESIRLVGEVQGKRVLDLGCGSGAFTKCLSELGAECIGVDLSRTFIDLAVKSYPGIKFLQMNAADMRAFPNSHFDKIVMRMVLVNIDDKDVVTAIFKECSRILKPRGELIFSIHHPLTIQDFCDSIREVKLPPNGSYTTKDMHYKVRLLFTDGDMFEFNNYHWPIDVLVREVAKNNFQIVELTSPTIPHGNALPSFAEELHARPYYMFFKCLKLETLATSPK